MKHGELFQELKEGAVRRVYLFQGVEEFTKDAALRRIETMLLPEGLEAFNLALLGESALAREIIAACEQLPVMADRRVVVVNGWVPLLGRAKDEAVEVEQLDKYLENPPESACLIFFVRGKPDGRRKASLMLQRRGCVVDFDTLGDYEAATWVTAQFSKRGKRVAPQLVSQLLFRVGRDLNVLSGEIAKLCDFVGGREEIAQRDVEEITTEAVECTVFRMIDALLAGKPEAFSMLTALVRDGEGRVGLLFMIARQYRLLLYAGLLLARGANAQAIGKAIGISGYGLTRTVQQARALPVERAQEAVEACLDADYSIKSGAVREEMALDRLMLRLSHLK